jgi:hypothetical protein
LITWQNVVRKPALQDHQLRDFVIKNVDLVLKRAQALSCKAERERVCFANVMLLAIFKVITFISLGS